MEYKVIYGYDSDFEKALVELQSNVNDWMHDGYKPIGGVAISEKGRITIATQAMIKETDL